MYETQQLPQAHRIEAEKKINQGTTNRQDVNREA